MVTWPDSKIIIGLFDQQIGIRKIMLEREIAYKGDEWVPSFLSATAPGSGWLESTQLGNINPTGYINGARPDETADHLSNLSKVIFKKNKRNNSCLLVNFIQVSFIQPRIYLWYQAGNRNRHSPKCTIENSEPTENRCRKMQLSNAPVGAAQNRSMRLHEPSDYGTSDGVSQCIATYHESWPYPTEDKCNKKPATILVENLKKRLDDAEEDQSVRIKAEITPPLISETYPGFVNGNSSVDTYRRWNVTWKLLWPWFSSWLSISNFSLLGVKKVLRHH